MMMRKATFKEKFTYENFKRAWVTITSHSHGSISMRESIDTRKLVVVNTSLVPIADLFAHDSSENICLKKFEGYEMENGAKVKDAGFVVTASKDFKIGPYLGAVPALPEPAISTSKVTFTLVFAGITS